MSYVNHPSMLVGLFKHPRAGLKKYFSKGPSHLGLSEQWFLRCVNLPPARMRNSPNLGPTSILDKLSFARPRSTVQTGVQKPIKGLLIQEGYRTHRVVVVLGEVCICCASVKKKTRLTFFKMVSYDFILKGSKVVYAASGTPFSPVLYK